MNNLYNVLQSRSFTKKTNTQKISNTEEFRPANQKKVQNKQPPSPMKKNVVNSSDNRQTMSANVSASQEDFNNMTNVKSSMKSMNLVNKSGVDVFVLNRNSLRPSTN